MAQFKYLVEFNNGFESDENENSKGFNSLDEAKKYAKENCEKYFKIVDGDFEFENGIYQGAGTSILSNCNDKSMSWFYSYTADFCEVDKL